MRRLRASDFSRVGGTCGTDGRIVRMPPARGVDIRQEAAVAIAAGAEDKV